MRPARTKLGVQPAVSHSLLGLFHFSLLLEHERVLLHQRVSVAIRASVARQLWTVAGGGLILSDRL